MSNVNCAIHTSARDLTEAELRLFAKLNGNCTALYIANVSKSDVHKCISDHVALIEPVLAARGLHIQPIQHEVTK